nr:hypothetical protein [Tanacetum cinerariifolium]
AFATIINKCLSGKETGMDKIRLSCSNPLGNKMFWHTARDNTVFTSMRCISKHEKTQVYGSILPKELTNQEMLESKAYNTYYAFASGEKTPKPKYVQKKADFDTSSKQKLVQATKGTRLKTKAKVAKSKKNKQPVKKPKARGLAVLSEVALTEAKQLKLATKRSKTQFHISHANGSGDGFGTQSKIPDEQHLKTISADEGTGTIPGFSMYPYTNLKVRKSLGVIVKKKMKIMKAILLIKVMVMIMMMIRLGNKDTEMTNAGQGTSKQQNTSQQSGFEQEEEDAHVTLTPVLNTQKTRVDNEIASLMDTTAHHAIAIPKITSSFSTTTPPPPPFFNPLSQQATPTLTPTALETTTSLPALPDFASVFKFNERVINLEKDLSKMKQVDQYAQALSSIPAIVDRYMDNKLGEAINKASQAHNFDCKEEAQAKKKGILPQAISDVATPVIEKNVIESLEAAILTRSSSQPQSSYEAAATLSEFKLTKILIDKMEKNKSFEIADYKRELYDALVKSYNTDKDIFESYGEVFSLKRSQDDKDKDQDPSVGLDRGTKRRKSSKDAESSRDSKSKEKKSSSTSKGASQSQHKSFGKSAYAEEPSHIVEDSGMQQDQEFITGDNDEQSADKEVRKADWFKKPERPSTPDPDWSKRQQVDFRPPQAWISQVVCAEEPPTSFDELNDTSFDFSAFVMNRLKILNLTQEILVGPAFNLLKGTCKSITERIIIAVTRLKIIKKYDYGHLEEIEVLRDDQKLYMFREGDFKRLLLQDIEDMLLLLVQKRLTNLTIDERYDLNVALRMRKRLIRADKLQKFDDGTLNDVRSALHDIAAGIRMEYLPMRKWSNLDKQRARVMIQGVVSYQKKLNLTKPDTYRSNLRNKTAYTLYSDPHGIIYVDQRKRLIRADKLQKFDDGTLNDVRSALHDIAVGIRMEYLPMRKWSNLDKQRARVMIQGIDRKLYQRRLMRNLEKFVGGREYENDLRLLERII